MIRVAVCGCAGKMGSTLVSALSKAEDIQVACGIDPSCAQNGAAQFPVYASLAEALQQTTFDVMVDFTVAAAAKENIPLALSKGVHCVVGTTGITEAELQAFATQTTNGAVLFYAPNFTLGAVLMMKFSEMAARYFDEAEIIEFHHAGKKDSPSGTALRTAHLIDKAREATSETSSDSSQPARGLKVGEVAVHSVRTNGVVANQEVIFGSMGQTLTITHESWDRQSYMPGVLLAIRKVSGLSGLVIGLDKLLDL